ncbi:unnamed protein product [Caenorhabditis auriculariae]|uniref:CPSF6/7 RSLD domain-containing protein n=1 Tax=Caenorhabditis auriculariae TaxID=2777116 RepID=A0A8S1HI85_9PELO|nr:unnamed protein product [Caenorhabditis auriculariae]
MAEIDEAILLGDSKETGRISVDDSVLDLDSDIAGEDEASKLKKEDLDLYDDVIAPSNTSFDSSTPVTTVPATTTPVEVKTQQKYSYSSSGAATFSTSTDKKYCCYVGNMVWWNTDADLMKLMAEIGLARSDFADMKFFENRTNGQSRGYALMVMNTEKAVKTLLEQLPSKQMHGQNPIVLPYSKISLAKLEDGQAKPLMRADTKAKKIEENCVNMGTIRIGGTSSGGGMMMGNRGPAGMMIRPSGPTPLMQPLPGPPPTRIMPMNGGMAQPMMNRPQPLIGAPPQQQGPTAAGIAQQLLGVIAQTANPGGQMRQMMPNTNTLPPPMQQPMMSAPPPNNMPFMTQGPPPNMQARPPQFNPNPMGYGQPQPLMGINTAMKPPQAMPVHVNPQMLSSMQGGHMSINEVEFEEIMNRNRTVASSAISRAVADASSGDIKSATETLLMAIDLIKSSRASHDDRCRLLVNSLEDTLKGIENKAYPSSSRSKHRDPALAVAPIHVLLRLIAPVDAINSLKIYLFPFFVFKLYLVSSYYTPFFDYTVSICDSLQVKRGRRYGVAEASSGASFDVDGDKSLLTVVPRQKNESSPFNVVNLLVKLSSPY